ncbi:60S acidic ribosomal protein P1 [Conglomerata obtusa]
MHPKPGTIRILHTHANYNLPITLQLLNLERLRTSGDITRYKSLVSDAKQTMKAIFASKLTSLFDSGAISEKSVVEVGKYLVKEKDGEMFLIVHDFEHWEECGMVIGNPVPYNRGDAGRINDEPKRRDTSMSKEDQSKNNNIEKENSRNTNESNNETKSKSNINTSTINNDASNNNASKNNASNSNASKNTNINTPIKTSSTHLSNTLINDLMHINALNPFHNKWTIKGRCLSKSDIKLFTNAKGEGKLFTLTLADETGSIKVTAFSDSVDLFYNLFDINKVYTITKGQVKLSNKKFNPGTVDYEIMLDKNSEVKIVYDDSAPKYFFRFIKFNELCVNTSVDIIGAVKSVSDLQTVIAKNSGKEIKKRNIFLVDETGGLRVTLWGTSAGGSTRTKDTDISNDAVKDNNESDFDIQEGDILAMTSVNIKEYNGITASTIPSTIMHRNPDLEESFILKGWYDKTGKDIKIKESIRDSKLYSLGEIKENENRWATFLGTIMFLAEDNLYYDACCECNKKVTNEDGVFRCERCNKIFDTCIQKYLIKMQVGDFTNQIYVTCFDDCGKGLFNFSAMELKEMREESSQVQSLVKGVLFKDFLIKINMKKEDYNGELRSKYTIQNLEEVDYIKESKKLLSIINECKN